MVVQVSVVVKRISITSAEVIITVEVNCVSSVGGISLIKCAVYQLEQI